MQTKKSVPFTLTIPKQIRDFLRKLAAEENIKNPDQTTTASSLGRDILCNYFETFMGTGRGDNGRVSI